MKNWRTTYSRISVYLATGIVVSMPVPANVEHRFQQKTMYTCGDCYSTAPIFYLPVVLWRSAGSSWELKVPSVGAVCVVGKCVGGSNVGLLGELRQQFLTRVCLYICMYIYICVCVCVSMYICTYVCKYVCTYVSFYVSKYVCMYVCVYGCV